MSPPIAKSDKWLAVLQQRRLANIEYWLRKLDTCEELATFVLEEYDNLLRTLESALQQDGNFDLAYRLIRKLSLVVFGYVDWERWLVYLEAAVNMSRRLQREAERAFLLERIGHIHIHRAEYEQAELLYREAAEIFQKSGDLESYAYTLSRLGQTTYTLRHNLRESVTLCQQAIQLGHQLQNSSLIGHAYDALAYVYERAREWELCLEAAQAAYRIFQHSNQPRVKEYILSRIVTAYIFLEEWEAVNESAAQLTEMFTAIGDIDGLSEHKTNLGVAAFKQKNYALAEVLWQEALSLQSQIQRPLSLANIYNNLGKVYTRLSEWEAAHDFLQKAIQIFEEMADRYNWANSMDNLVDLYEAQGEVDKCRAVLEQVLTRLQNVDPDAPVQKLLSTMEQRRQTLLQAA
jgi:tetratricopeptide (TPR) repeat protein